MFAFIRFAGHIKTLNVWQRAQPLQFFSSVLSKKQALSNDPTTRRQQLDNYNTWHKEKYAQDREFRARRNKSSRDSKQALSDFDKHIARRDRAFFMWVANGVERGEVRTWPTHTPEYGSAKQTRRCTECGSYRNKRMWWKRNDHYGSYDVRMTSATVYGPQDQHLAQSWPIQDYADLAVCLQCHTCFVNDWSRVSLTGYKHRDRHASGRVKSEQKPDLSSDETSDQVKHTP
jgi:hypothetical protein